MEGLIDKKLEKTVTPFIEGNLVTFVWKGKNPPRLEGDVTGWEMNKTIKLKQQERGIWTFETTFPPDAYIEYAFRRGEKSYLDPYNPRKTSNGVGGFNNYFSMPNYEPTNLARSNPVIQRGMITTHIVPSDYLLPTKYRTVRLYQPPVSFSVPLLVVWDGQDYLKRLKLNVIVDNLISMGRIQPLAIAFVDNGGQRNRTIEYACSESTLVFLMNHVLPLAKKELNLINEDHNPGAFGVLGASMGGLMALYTGIRLPKIFGHVFSQSGAFSWADLDMVIFDLVQNLENVPLKVWMDVGIYDLAGLLEVNRRMKDLLEQKGYSLSYHEYHAGHNYPAWRNDIWRGLEALYGI